MTKLHHKIQDIASSTKPRQHSHPMALRRLSSKDTEFRRLSSKDTSSIDESTKSMASLILEMSDTDLSIFSAARSFRQPTNQSEFKNKKGKKKSLLRRSSIRGSTLSGTAHQALSTLHPSGCSNTNNSNSSDNTFPSSNMEAQDSKASMVYDVPFDPITGRCNYHPSVCMAVKDVDMAGKSKKMDSSMIVGEWTILKNTCPKCLYNY